MDYLCIDNIKHSVCITLHVIICNECQENKTKKKDQLSSEFNYVYKAFDSYEQKFFMQVVTATTVYTRNR